MVEHDKEHLENAVSFPELEGRQCSQVTLCSAPTIATPTGWACTADATNIICNNNAQVITQRRHVENRVSQLEVIGNEFMRKVDTIIARS